MGKLLFDSRPLVVPTELACKVGLNEAIVLQQIHYWTVINEKAGKNFVDGAYWVYRTVEEWREEFKFWSKCTIVRIIAKLEKAGLLVSDNHNASKVDRTKWYRINYEKLQEIEKPDSRQDDQIEPDVCSNPETHEAAPFRQDGGMHSVTHEKRETAPFYQSDKMHFITPTNPEKAETAPFYQSDKMHFSKMTKCILSKRANAFSQNDHINTIDYIKDYIEKDNNNNSITIDNSRARQGGGGVVVVSPKTGNNGRTESPYPIPGAEAEELVALYTQVTGLTDLSPRFLSALMREVNVDSEYVREKLLLLDSAAIRAPLPWLVAALKKDFRAAQKKADKPANGGSRADPDCPACGGAGWRIITVDEAGYPREHAEPCPCQGRSRL
jgi:hypothetical protein